MAVNCKARRNAVRSAGLGPRCAAVRSGPTLSTCGGAGGHVRSKPGELDLSRRQLRCMALPDRLQVRRPSSLTAVAGLRIVGIAVRAEEAAPRWARTACVGPAAAFS